MKDSKCLFCKIAAGEEASEIVWENEEFLCIENKYPVAPVHVLVIPKKHRVKTEWVLPSYADRPTLKLRNGIATERLKLAVLSGEFWGKMMLSIFSVVSQLGLDKSGYKLVNNGAGYNHFEHEHMHILGGTKSEPGGTT